MTVPPRRAPVPSASLRGLVTDIDGTLTDAARRIDPTVAAAIRAVTDRGWPVVLATGNVLPIALAIHRSLGLTGPIVAENGGLLYERRNGRDHVTRLADRSVAVVAFRAARRAGLPVRRLFTDRWRETEIGLEPTVSVARLRAATRGLDVHVESTGFAIHLIQRGHGKLPALERALAPLGLSLADCVVAGDGDNDVAMLRAAGVGVTFPTASPRARRAASRVTRAAGGAGFVEALMALGVYERPADAGSLRDARRHVRSLR